MTDNVRKVFEILGVEPEEWFELKDRNGKYCINKSLYGYRIDECNEGSKCDWILSLVLYNPENIIKLPKKKKIGDLTVNDMPKCWKTLFNISPAFMCLFTENEEKFNKAKSLIPKEILNKEIEVEENA